MVASPDEFANSVEIVPGRLYFTAVKRLEGVANSQVSQGHITFQIDTELVYEPFFADFGPLNLGKTFRFCQKLKGHLAEGEAARRKVFFYCGPHGHARANAAVLIGIYQVIYLGLGAEEAYKALIPLKPFVPFRDASCGPSTFHLTVLDCIKGMQRARDVGFIDWGSAKSTWSVDEYEFYEKVENGDLTWILPGKLLAFSGPASRCNEIPGYRLLTPEDYIEYYKKRNVTAVVRLNKKMYDKRRFTDAGIRHYDLYFPDGTCPSEAIIHKFLEISESEPGALAVHCKAGLGRTGVLILCYLMKHYRFTAQEAIGYIRICRPGSVIGLQQNFVRDVEQKMWIAGEVYRDKHGLPKGQWGHIPANEFLTVSGGPPVSHNRTSPSTRTSGSGTGRELAAHQHSLPNAADAALLQQYNSLQDGNRRSSRSIGGLANSVASLYGGGVGSPGRSGARGGIGHPKLQVSVSSNGSGGGSALSSPKSPVTTPKASILNKPTALSAVGSFYAPASSAPVGRNRAPSADRASERIHPLGGGAVPRSPAGSSPSPSPSSTAGTWKIPSSPSDGIPNSPGTPGLLGLRSSMGSPYPGSPPSQVLPMGNNKTVAVARTLAPNGQPRKVPITMLSQYHALMGAGHPAIPHSSSAGAINVLAGPISPGAASPKGVGGLRVGSK